MAYKTDTGEVYAGWFEIDQAATAAANTIAINEIINSGRKGSVIFPAGTIQFNGPIVWPNGIFPVGQGADATIFENAAGGTNDGFQFIDPAPDIRSSHPRDFAMTSTGGTGRAIYAENFGNSDILDSITVFGMGGDGIVLNNCYNLTGVNIRTGTCAGRGLVTEGECFAVNFYNLQSTFNTGHNVEISGGGGIAVYGGDFTSSATGHGCYIHNTFNITLSNIYIEGVPHTSTGHYGIYVGPVLNAAIGPIFWGDDVDPTGRTLIRCTSDAQFVTVSDLTGGGGVGVSDVLINFESGAAFSSANLQAVTTEWVNSSATCRVYQSPGAEGGVRATGNGSPQSVTVSTETPVSYITELADLLSEWSTDTFTPNDFGSYLITGSVQLTHNDGAAASNQVNIDIYNSATSTILALPVVSKGFVSGSVLNYSFLTNTLGHTSTIQVRVLYTPGTGTPTVSLSGTATTNQIQIIRLA